MLDPEEEHVSIKSKEYRPAFHARVNFQLN